MNILRDKKDTLTIAVFAGTVAKLIQDALGQIVILGFLPSYLGCVRIAGGLILTRNQVMNGGIWPALLGLQIDIIVGIAVAFVAVLALQRWGTDYSVIKGAIVGLASWVLFYNVLSRLLSRVHPGGSVLQAEVSFFTHLAFGISLVQSAIWFSKWLNRPGNRNNNMG